ncbi:aldehyde ferredoxin oxidoreductase, partial [Candidatus Geothermarchaeota archaeon]
MALAYATADRGADHLRAWSIAEEAFGELDPFTAEGKAEIVKRLQDLNSVKWCMIWCDFIAINYEEMSRYLNLVTGWDTTPEELAFKGERIWNLIRLFNVREGFRREDDYIPYKIAYEPMPSGPAKGKRVSPEDFEKMLDAYYKLRGWNREGIPTRKKLAQLRLGRVAKKYSYPRYHP